MSNKNNLEDGKMKFFLVMNPPTVTAQMKKVKVVNDKPVFYEPQRLKEARKLLLDCLVPQKPPAPLQGPLALRVQWLFPRGTKHLNGEWRVSRPDTDNLEKMLKDCMTAAGFWKDDAQVVSEYVEKRWSDYPYGIYIEIEELEGKQYEL